jgi:uncharacterized protein
MGYLRENLCHTKEAPSLILKRHHCSVRQLRRGLVGAHPWVARFVPRRGKPRPYDVKPHYLMDRAIIASLQLQNAPFVGTLFTKQAAKERISRMTDALTFFKQAPLYTDNVDYLLIKLHPRAITVAAGVLAEIGDPFGAMIADKGEVTLVIPAEVLEDFEARLPGAQFSEAYRLISLDMELPPTLTGFMAHIARILAEAGVPVVPIGAFSRDHLLVPAAHFQKAWDTLQAAQKA